MRVRTGEVVPSLAAAAAMGTDTVPTGTAVTVTDMAKVGVPT